ncbi:DUF4097 family beta strand repeat-containing protein [Treponema pedis]|uniref:DUF4097 family beta strand repeat-containing protein n=1 Tax=Treponema pedis TaxID=409322 RepID=UPI000411A586|nr:DUF4097 family beta strand repeat-containing protein [Treponema pedis]
MKKNLILAAAWFFAAALITAFFVTELQGYGITKGNKFCRFPFVFKNGHFTSNVTVLKEERFNASEITFIKASLTYEDIRFKPSLDNTFSIKIIGNDENKNLPEIRAENGTLYITAFKNNRTYFGWYNNLHCRIEISVPVKKQNSMENTGNKMLTDLISVFIEGSSSDITLEDIALKNFKFESSSGDLTLRDSEIANLLEVHTASGDIRGTADIYKFTVNSTSGDLRLKLLSVPTELSKFYSTSGDYLIYLPADIDGFSCNFNSVSGDYKNAFTGTSGEKKVHEIYKNEAPQFFIETVSGDCRIRKF